MSGANNQVPWFDWVSIGAEPGRLRSRALPPRWDSSYHQSSGSGGTLRTAAAICRNQAAKLAGISRLLDR